MAISGIEFESMVKPFFENLFKEIGFIVTEIGNQKSGTQNGFDILIAFNDLKGAKRNIFIECKYYKSKLRWDAIFEKQLQLNGSNYEIDGFIVLSPKENLSNINHNLQNTVSNLFGFPVDFWTPNNGIEKIFALNKSLYESVYNKKCTLTVDEAEQLEKVKALINNLLIEKDNPSGKKPPEKRYYAKPQGYINRSVASNSIDGIARFFEDRKGLNEIIKTNNKIALLGWAGTGKSIELEQLAYELSFSNIFSYPFLIKLNVHTDESIADRISEIDSIPNNLIVLLLDGLDEVQAENLENIRRKVLRFSEDYPEARIIVSCRSNFYTTVSENGSLNTLPGFASFQLVDLQLEDIDDYLLQNMPLKKDSFLKEVRDKQLERLLHIPYYLIKLVEQYLNNGAIANSKAELFESVITENINKDAFRYYSTDRDIKAISMRKLLEKLALILEYQGKNHCTWEELLRIFPLGSELEMIKRSASLLDGYEGAGGTWKFSHNNIQEYLVAKVLSERKLDGIKKIIAFKPNYKKIKPTWVNTLSFLISILEKKVELRENLIKWITQNEPELIVKFEPDKLDNALRFHIFEKIFNYYEKENRRINTAIYSHRELSLFSLSEQTLKFLIEKIQQNVVAISKANALELIAYLEIERNFPHYISQIKQLVESILYESEPDLKYLSLKAYISLFKLSETEFEKLLNTFHDSQDKWIRHMMFTAIYQQNYQDKYVLLVIEFTKKQMETEYGSNDDRLANEYYDLKECLVNAKSQEAIKKILLFIKDDYTSISYSVYFREVIKEVLEYAAQTFPMDEDIYVTIKEIFDSKNINGHDPQIKMFIEYFEASGNRLKAFKDIYTAKHPNLNYEVLSHLAFLANEEGIKFLANEFKVGKIDKKIAENFQWQLEWNNKQHLILFNKLVNEKEQVEPPSYKYDIEKERKANAEETMILLSDKEKFKAAVEQVFIDGGKDDLTFNDIWDLQNSDPLHRGKYLNTVFETVRPNDRNGTINKTNLLAFIENNWNIFSIRKINHFLKMDKNNALSADLISYVKKWCDEMITKPGFSFKSGIYFYNSGHMEFDKYFIILSTFIRRLGFISYSQDLYLDLLSFPKLDDEVDIIDFVESILPKEMIDKRILTNLTNNIRIPHVLERHVAYCSKNKLNQAANLLIPYLQNEETYNRYELLVAYIKFNGSIAQLEQILPSITDDFKFNIIQELIKHESKVALQHVLSLFSSTKEKKHKIKLAGYLIKMQNIEGVKYYIQFIKENRYLPDDSIASNPLYKLTNFQAFTLILYLYELAFDEQIKQDKFNNLKHIASTALQSICLKHDNYLKAKRRFEIYKLVFKVRTIWKKEKLPIQIIQDLSYYFEIIAQQYYVNKSNNISLDDAISTYTKLN